MNANHQAVIKEPLEQLLVHIPEDARPIIGQAYHLAHASHEGQERDAGEPYIIHPIKVAIILASELGFARDAEMMVAALLHDSVEDSALAIEDIEPTFGKSITDLIQGVTKAADGKNSRTAQRTATLQNLFTAARKDPRVLILKLADRVHNMRTISGIPESKRRRRIAQETADVYAPLSHFLGMGRIRRELENRSLECLEPKVSDELYEVLSQDPCPKSQDFMEAVQTALQDTGIRTRIRLQTKSLPSIYRKVLRSNLSALEIHNRYFIEVMVSHRDTCYRALGVLHGNFAPVTERFKDFIALPKRNGYQALHTNVIHQGSRYEVHIQTPGMHRMGELGLATLRGNTPLEEKRMQWLHELAEWHDTSANSNRLMDELQRILFTREIAVFTPRGDTYVLPENATVLDFAFAVHTDLGLHCKRGRVNGRRVSPFSTLSLGDTVEIEIDKAQHPKRHWLSRVKTYRARRLIRRYLTRQDPGKSSRGLMFG